MKEAMLMMTQFYFVKCSRQHILFLLNLVQMLFSLFVWWAAEDDSRIFINFNFRQFVPFQYRTSVLNFDILFVTGLLVAETIL